MDYCKKLFLLCFLFVSVNGMAQSCDCGKEFLHIKGFMEQNYVGYADKLKTITPPVYDSLVKSLQQLSTTKVGKQKCLLVILTYLSKFKDDHVQISATFDGAITDSSFIGQQEHIEISEKKMAALKTSVTMEGIYNYKYDTAYKIAVLKDPTMFRDYVGVIVESKSPLWKKGMVKLEAKQYADSLYKGVLYTRNLMPMVRWFAVEKNNIGGDWQREGTTGTPTNNGFEPVAAKRLSDKTLYLKIATFDASNGKRIDSMVKANKHLLDSLPYLVLDLRNNGGGADFAYEPIMPYIYTNPIKTIGLDVLSTDSTIAGWRHILLNNNLPEATRQNLKRKIALMEANKGKLVNVSEDDIDSSYKPSTYPKKVVILVNGNCASTTEQFLLGALQSTKVIVAGENTGGVLDYANVRETPFSCMPYILVYSSTRSRRLDVGQGIDNVGIKPNIYLKKGSDWVVDAVRILEKE